jgi:hypothetical protein
MCRLFPAERVVWVSDSEKPQIAYVLGKAYYQRGYYYADLSMKYLDYAYKSGFRNDDLAEFRGFQRL